ncbi:MAG TPA: glucose 1-dehydrogenase [Acidimicrobiales bacterium]|nr:glucose 1-dehydrogenase [Acidimicrobiales bacterium]
MTGPSAGRSGPFAAPPTTSAPPAERFDLTGKVALVTGGSRGLGRAMSLAFAAAGADVVVASRKLESCEEVAGLVRAMGRRALAVSCHVGHWNELETLAGAAYDAFGRVDVLVNNAGMSLLYRELSEVTEEMWDKVVDLNMKGVFRLTTLVGERMRQAGRGSVVNVSSTGSIRPTPWIVPYAAAKAGVNAMTEAFAVALGPEVRVNCIMAGPFFTDIAKAWDMPSIEQGLQRHALHRGGQPDEVVGAALYFASDASSFTTGAVLRVDGGIP